MLTRSPFSTPSPFSTLAKRWTESSISAYVIVRVSPGSPSQCSATRSPRPASTWRSRQLYDTLSVPPTNHLANGGSHSRIVCHSSYQLTSSAAWRAQNPCQSFSASSYTSAPVTSASALKVSGGGKVRSSTRSSSIAVDCGSGAMALPLCFGDLAVDRAYRRAGRRFPGADVVPSQRRRATADGGSGGLPRGKVSPMSRRTPLSRERVLAAALALVDAEGVEALTMR